MTITLLKEANVRSDTPSSKDRSLVAAINRQLRNSAVHRLYFNIPQTELLAGTAIEIVSPVAGNITGLTVIVQTAVTTGGDVTVNVGTTAVDGLTVPVASLATKGTVGSDAPSAADHATTVVAVGSRITVQGSAAFDTAGALAGYVEITETIVDPN